MRIINRRHFVKFYTMQTTIDSLGQRVRDWSAAPVASAMCEVKEERSVESGFQREVLENQVIIEFRPALMVKPEMRAEMEGINYIVQTVMPLSRTKIRVELIRQR